MDEILDDFSLESPRKPAGKKYYAKLIFIYFFGLLIISFICKYLPRNLIEYSGGVLGTKAILMLVYAVLMPKILIKDLNSRLPGRSILNLLSIMLGIILIANLGFSNIDLFTSIEKWHFGYFLTHGLMSPIISSLYTVLFAWTRINRIRKKSVWIPYTVMFIFIASIYYLASI